MRVRSAPIGILAVLLAFPSLAGVEVTTTKSLTIQPNGPRTGDNGKKFFNIEGKDNARYASFGVLVFEMPKKLDASKIKSVELTLTQSIARFSKDGAVKFYLAPDLDPAAGLQFDSTAENGVGKQIKTLNDLGSGTFKKGKTGETQSFTLKLDDDSRKRIAKQGKLCLVIVPADSAVAATYAGVGESDEGHRPKLKLEEP